MNGIRLPLSAEFDFDLDVDPTTLPLRVIGEGDRSQCGSGEDVFV
ncbi:hypothetical protein ACFL59_15410 [Planctomycetota bacterium]